MHRHQRGITLIELMIVVAILGILAGGAVVMFGGTKKKTEAKAEVTQIFAEMKTRQEQYYIENNSYLSTGTDEGDMFPAAPSADGSTTSLVDGRPATWDQLRMSPDKSSVLCSYVAIAGDAGDPANIGAIASGDFEMTDAPVDDWYYLLAQCNMDQDNTTDSFYFTRSDTDGIFFINQGK